MRSAGFLRGSKGQEASTEVVVEVPTHARLPPCPLDFVISPESLENVKKTALQSIPGFHIRGRLDRTRCPLSEPFTGEVTIVSSSSRIRSIELQLVRLESLAAGGAASPSGPGARSEATEIQNLQVADGHVCQGLSIPLFMAFPRVFTCPTIVSDTFRVEFEVNVIVVFEGGFLVTKNLPIVLYRDPPAGVGAGTGDAGSAIGTGLNAPVRARRPVHTAAPVAP
jgi:hypothetical protein